MKIVKIRAKQDWKLVVTSDDGLVGEFDVKPYLLYEAFACLANPNEFRKVSNGGYFVEWECGADLSADTIEAKWKVIRSVRAHLSA